MPPPYERHVFICTNDRGPEHPKGSCCQKGGDRVKAALKARLKARGLDDRIRANAAGCLDLCELGITMVVYPEGTWYRQVTENDVEEIVESHLVGGRPVERLVWRRDLP